MRKGHALRHGDWKIVAPGKGAPELFNLAADPYENTDHASDEPAKLAELQALLAAQIARDNPTLPADLVGVPE